MVVVLIFILVGFGIYKAILVPLSGRETTEWREYRATPFLGLSGEQQRALDTTSWNVVLVRISIGF